MYIYIVYKVTYTYTVHVHNKLYTYSIYMHLDHTVYMYFVLYDKSFNSGNHVNSILYVYMRCYYTVHVD